nr:vegetative cell wall protein gp1-like [Lolium perenne]
MAAPSTCPISRRAMADVPNLPHLPPPGPPRPTSPSPAARAAAPNLPHLPPPWPTRPTSPISRRQGCCARPPPFPAPPGPPRHGRPARTSPSPARVSCSNCLFKRRAVASASPGAVIRSLFVSLTRCSTPALVAVDDGDLSLGLGGRRRRRAVAPDLFVGV